MSALATAVGPHVFWITSRAAGTAALFLSSASVSVGLLMGRRLVRGRGPDLRALHEALSLATIAALLVHGLSLLGDHYVHVNLAEISIPFLSHYKTGWTAVGIVSAWALILLGPSYYVRRAIGQERWRKLHRFTALAWVAGLVHSLGEGTDAGSIWFLTMAALTTLPAFVMLILRNFQASTAQ